MAFAMGITLSLSSLCASGGGGDHIIDTGSHRCHPDGGDHVVNVCGRVVAVVAASLLSGGCGCAGMVVGVIAITIFMFIFVAIMLVFVTLSMLVFMVVVMSMQVEGWWW